MNVKLQIILLLGTIIFFLFVIKMVKNNKLELRYSLTWISSSIIFILFAAFPTLLTWLAELLYIKETVNALFLAVLFFLLVINITLTFSLSKKSNSIKNLSQEVGILKHTVESLLKQQQDK